MSVLRPTRKLTDPHGGEWEIYVSRVDGSRWTLGRELLTLLERIRPPEEPQAAQKLQIEAVTYLPHPETYRWSTTSDHVTRVIDQIAAGIEAGDLARPLGAVFHGSDASRPDTLPAESRRAANDLG
jgi:hypothetical protein